MCKQKDPDDRGKWASRGILIITILFAVALFLGGAWLTRKDADETWRAEAVEETEGLEDVKTSGWENAGIRGDFWGGHAAAVSGLIGAVLMFGALVLQSHELGLQRKDLKVQQTEFKKARKEAEKQTKAMEGQLAHVKRQAETEKYDAMLRLLMDIGERAVVAREHRQKDPRPLLKAGFGRIIEQAHRDVNVAEQAEYPMAMVDEMLELFLATVGGIASEQINKAWEQAVEMHRPARVAHEQDGESAGKRMGKWIESTSKRIKASCGQMSLMTL